LAAVGDVRRATLDDLAVIGDRLALAFADDPVSAAVLPPSSRNRHHRLASFLRLGAAGGLRHGEVWTTPDGCATAVWRAPGRWKVSNGEALRSTPALLRALGRHTVTGFRVLQAIEARHPAEPHWYLEILGTAPAYQGKGLGAAAMAPVLERCDDDGVGAYLESSKERNVPYYRRFGFEVTEQLVLPCGPSVWLMWRDPR
jgi:GNAT superfamily N-acetyltransferase